MKLSKLEKYWKQMPKRSHIEKMPGFALYTFVFLLMFVIAPQSSIAEKSEPYQGVYTGSKTDFENFGYLVAGSVWKFELLERKVIGVCWENPTPDNAHARKITREQIEKTWQRVTALTFIGWMKCAKNNHGIRILYADSGPKVAKFGSKLNGIKNGMVLNHVFENWKPACPYDTDTCIRAIAVHEFGHALGFAHEQNRPDAEGECAKEKNQGQPNEILLTPYDKYSVMNYCNDANNVGELSELDVLAVQKLYGKP